MTEKKRLHVKVNEDIYNSIKNISSEENITQGDVITKAMENYQKESSEQYMMFMDIVSKLIEQKTKEINQNLRRLQITGNVIDRDTQIILEFMNHYYLANDFKALGSTDKYKTEGLLEAEKLINDRIQKQRQKKLDADKQKV